MLELGFSTVPRAQAEVLEEGSRGEQEAGGAFPGNCEARQHWGWVGSNPGAFAHWPEAGVSERLVGLSHGSGGDEETGEAWQQPV